MVKEYFDSRFSFDKRRDFVWGAIAKYLQRYIPRSFVVLDLGAGYSNFINKIEARKKFALDIEPAMKRFADSDVDFRSGSCTNLRMFKSEQFDCVFTSNVLEHLDRSELKKTISEVRRVLKKDGRLIIIQPNFKYSFREYFDDYTHITPFSEVGLADFLSANGFESERVVARFIPFSMKSRAGALYFLTPLYPRLPIRPFAKQMLIVARKR